jgi:hypothetical protein
VNLSVFHGFLASSKFRSFSLAKSISNRRKFIAQICCSCEVNFLGNFPIVSGGVVGRLLFLWCADQKCNGG